IKEIVLEQVLYSSSSVVTSHSPHTYEKPLLLYRDCVGKPQREHHMRNENQNKIGFPRISNHRAKIGS
ncbi:hypothetical protein BHM03_00018528, partial [Ensete ventricosum]